MQIINTLHEHIDEELQDACEYAKMALEYKDTMHSVADTFYQLSKDEMGHAMTLHSEVVRIIEDYREEHGDPPADMLAVYNYLHKREIDKSEKIKRLQAFYKD